MESIFLEKAEQFLESRKYSNNLIDILESKDDPGSGSRILAIEMIFTEILHRRTMLIQDDAANKDEAASKYVLWLRNCYEDSWKAILNDMAENKSEQAVSTLFKLLGEEGKHPTTATQKGKYYFPRHKLKRIADVLITRMKDNRCLMKFVDEYTNYIDIVYYLWLCLPSLLKHIAVDNMAAVQNALNFLEKLPVPSEEELSTQDPEVILCYSKNKSKFRPSYSEIKKAVTETWNIMARWKCTAAAHKQLLTILIDQILHNLLQPVLCLDYLMESMNSKGVVALLALQGIFVLVKDYNLEHPNIFGKLYCLLEPDIFSSNYKARLFQLTNIFMSSTHLPEVMVASFAKRMARLCLHAAPQDIILMATFIGNLLIRHPGLKVLISRPTGGTVSSDPFLMDESDPMKTRAIESSLWEMQVLQNHIVPKVSQSVSFINKSLPNVEWDITEKIKSDYDQMFKKEVKKKKIQKVAVTFEKPTCLSMPRSSYFSGLWSLTR